MHSSFPGARYADRGVRYVTVCGRTVEGRRRDKRSKEPRTPPAYAHDAYKEVRGSAHDTTSTRLLRADAQ